MKTIYFLCVLFLVGVVSASAPGGKFNLQSLESGPKPPYRQLSLNDIKQIVGHQSNFKTASRTTEASQASQARANGMNRASDTFQLADAPTLSPRHCNLNNINVIVAGAGTAGSTIVYKLLKYGQGRPCILFVGNGGNVSLTEPDGTEMPFGPYNTFESPFPPQALEDNSLETTPGTTQSQQPYIWKNPARGGATAYNTGVVNPQDRRLHDKMATLLNEPEWNAEAARVAWNDITNYEQDGSFPDDPVTRSWHGFGNPMPMSVSKAENFSHLLCKSFEAVTGNPCYPDANIGLFPGGGVHTRSCDLNGDRGNAFDRFLIRTGYMTQQADGSLVSNVPNLIYYDYVNIEKVLFTQSSHGSTPAAYGVAYSGLPNPNGGAPLSGVWTVVPGGVVVSALGTPSIIDNLQLSGIGDCSYLSNLPDGSSIGCVVNNPAVGNNNVYNSLQGSGLVQFRQVTQRSGYNSINFYFQSNAAKTSGELLTDLDIGWAPITEAPWLAGDNNGDPNLYPISLWLPEQYINPGTYGFGTRRIKSASTSTKSYAAMNIDAAPSVDAIKTGRVVLDHFQAATGIEYLELSPGYGVLPKDATDAQYLAYVQSTMINDYGTHTYGGAPMCAGDYNGPIPAGCVTDPHMRVRGVHGLYLAGTVVYNTQISNHGYAYGALFTGAQAAKFVLRDIFNIYGTP